MACHCCNPARRWVLGGLLAAGAIPLTGRSGAAQPGPLLPSRLHRSAGSVWINGRAVEAGAAVAPGDTVATGPDGEAIFSLGDDGFLLRPQGEVTIQDTGTNPATGRPVRELSLESGRILSVFGPKEITLKTPHANVGIRGTAAYLESSAASTNVCVCYGHAVMVPLGAPNLAEEVRTRHHEAPRLIRPGPNGLVMEPYKVLNHTDEELVMLESLFGRIPPFK